MRIDGLLEKVRLNIMDNINSLLIEHICNISQPVLRPKATVDVEHNDIYVDVKDDSPSMYLKTKRILTMTTPKVITIVLCVGIVLLMFIIICFLTNYIYRICVNLRRSFPDYVCRYHNDLNGGSINIDHRCKCNCHKDQRKEVNALNTSSSLARSQSLP